MVDEPEAGDHHEAEHEGEQRPGLVGERRRDVPAGVVDELVDDRQDEQRDGDRYDGIAEEDDPLEPALAPHA